MCGSELRGGNTTLFSHGVQQPKKGQPRFEGDTMGMPLAAAALATASSPSGWAIRCIAMGAISTGNASLFPAFKIYSK